MPAHSSLLMAIEASFSYRRGRDSRILTWVRWQGRRRTSYLRALPDWVIIGAQRSGTTSLYEYLSAHSQVLPAFRKEVHFFDLKFGRGAAHYRSYFPLRSRLKARRDCRMTTGEATPNYLIHPLVPQRLAELLPRAKLIVLLRDPVERAYSSWRFKVRRGDEPESSFEKALDMEDDRIADDLRRLRRDEVFRPRSLLRWAYLRKGLYAEQLRRWFRYVPKEQFLILKSEDLFESTADTVAQVSVFLGLREEPLGIYPRYHAGMGRTLDYRLRRRLEDFFEEPNQELGELLGRDFSWNGKHPRS